MKTTGVSCETKFGLLVFLGHPIQHSPTFASSQYIREDVLIFALLSITMLFQFGFARIWGAGQTWPKAKPTRELSAFAKSNVKSNIGVNSMTSKRHHSDVNIV